MLVQRRQLGQKIAHFFIPSINVSGDIFSFSKKFWRSVSTSNTCNSTRAMSGELRFDGKVALVTGAGGGLGRQYALMFAERGASVVVNDLGGSATGEGKSQKAADVVVEEIKNKGGKAVANYESVENGESLVKTAISTFGRIDIVVNNAGILRDRSLARISDQDWDLIQKVHLRGSFMVTRAAWPHMRKQQYGRIIMTSSAAGIFGNFGQANYAAAKLGLLGLSNTVAVEGAKYNIQCNTVVPTAGSRMTQTVLPPDLVDALKPDYVAPLVMWLCHDDCAENGGVFEASGGWVGQFKWQRSKGAMLLKGGQKMLPEDVRDNWNDITDMSQSTSPSSVQEYTGALIQALSSVTKEPLNKSNVFVKPKAASGGGSAVDIEAVRARRWAPSQFTYAEKDAILYALGVGVSTTEPDYLKFLYEGSEDFSVIPTFAVCAAFSILNNVMSEGLPEYPIDVAKVMHGEHYIEVYKPFPPSGTLTNHCTVVDILDKGSGAAIIFNIDSRDESGEKVCMNEFLAFVVGAGNFGGRRDSEHLTHHGLPNPDRAPDASMRQTTSVDQAALYRLSGDPNPLHIDPSFSAILGFSRPIIHGMSSFGHAVRHILAQYADNDVSRFRAVKARFAKPVFPGQTLQTDMWKEGNRIFFACKVAETGAEALTGGYVDLAGNDTAVTSKTDSPNQGVKSAAEFDKLAERLASNPQVVKKVGAVFLWNITQGGKQAAQWTLDLKNGAGRLYTGAPPPDKKADCTLTLDDDDLVAMFSGGKNPQQLFMSGKLKIQGNVMLSQKLQVLLKDQSKL